MSVVIRSLLQRTLETMEAGKFQDFCLEFLPLFDQRFTGLSRHGHTVEGKTRPGTPDLLLTKPDGSQIGVQNGTEEGYWKRPEKDSEWKPHADAKKCIEQLEKPVELVLMPCREIPSSYPNAKTEVISSLKDKTSAVITPIAGDDISQFVSKLFAHYGVGVEWAKDRLNKETLPASVREIIET